MRPYLDAGFLLTVIIKTHGSAEAIRILSGFPAPYELNLLHQLQAESFLHGSPRNAEPSVNEAFTLAHQNWNHYNHEAVFIFRNSDWNSSMNVALQWIRSGKIQHPHALLVLHPAIALVDAFTHFLSFDPRSRIIAKATGLQVLPERL